MFKRRIIIAIFKKIYHFNNPIDFLVKYFNYLLILHNKLMSNFKIMKKIQK